MTDNKFVSDNEKANEASSAVEFPLKKEQQ